MILKVPLSTSGFEDSSDSTSEYEIEMLLDRTKSATAAWIPWFDDFENVAGSIFPDSTPAIQSRTRRLGSVCHTSYDDPIREKNHGWALVNFEDVSSRPLRDIYLDKETITSSTVIPSELSRYGRQMDWEHKCYTKQL